MLTDCLDHRLIETKLLKIPNHSWKLPLCLQWPEDRTAQPIAPKCPIKCEINTISFSCRSVFQRDDVTGVWSVCQVLSATIIFSTLPYSVSLTSSWLTVLRLNTSLQKLLAFNLTKKFIEAFSKFSDTNDSARLALNIMSLHPNSILYDNNFDTSHLLTRTSLCCWKRPVIFLLPYILLR